MINLALNRPATQSSLSPWSAGSPEEDARIANNGDILSARYFHTGREENPWWQVDLEGAFLIKRIMIHNRLDQQDRLKNFTVFRSLNGRDWFKLFKKADKTDFTEFCVDIAADSLARFIRIRLDGDNYLHFRECQIFGEPADPFLEKNLLAEDARALAQRWAIPEGRKGHIAEVGDFYVFVDEGKYSTAIQNAIDSGGYEGPERKLVAEFLTPTDRVLEIGTAIGAVSMMAASIVGDPNVATFDANPEIVEDAKENFRRNGLQGINGNLGVLACRRNFEENTEIEFHISHNFWASRLGATSDTSDIVRTVKVPIRCLEQEISSHNANVLICDIEGGEVGLLSGADLSGIRLIIMETHYWAAGERETDAMVRELINQGFSIHLGASAGHVSVFRRH
jgi:FkbM family methyltransferase